MAQLKTGTKVNGTLDVDGEITSEGIYNAGTIYSLGTITAGGISNIECVGGEITGPTINATTGFKIDGTEGVSAILTIYDTDDSVKYTLTVNKGIITDITEH